jgi:bacterioferritin
LKAEKEEGTVHSTGQISREQLIELLNEDLAGEYQAIISYVIYSQVLSGAEYMNIAGELEKHAGEELSHALIISKQIDYLGGMPAVHPKPVRTQRKPKKCFALILRTRWPQFGVTVNASLNAKVWASTRWPN